MGRLQCTPRIRSGHRDLRGRGRRAAIAVSQNVAAQAWADHQLRATIEEMVRRKLLDEIMERWKPAIRVRE